MVNSASLDESASDGTRSIATAGADSCQRRTAAPTPGCRCAMSSA